MHTVTTRIYDVDSAGRRFLLHRPGDVITDSEAKRVATLAESKQDTPGWPALLEHRDAPADETPAKPLDRMTLKELRAVCAAKGIDPDGANLRADYIKVIGAARGQRPTNER